MTRKMFVSAIVAGVLGGYVGMLYALIHILVLINRSYMLSLAM